MAVAMPSEPLAPWPLASAGHALAASYGHSAVLTRNLVKLSLVPDSSERWNAWMGVDGSLASGLSFLMAASSQLVILLLKMSPMVWGESCRLSTPGRL